MNKTKRKIAGGNVADDKTEGEKIIDSVDVLIVFGEFFVKRVDRFGATGKFEIDFFFFQKGASFVFDFFNSFGSGFVASFDESFKLLVALRVGIFKSAVGKFDAEFTHVETVSEWRKNFEGFGGDFFAFVGRKSGERTNIVKTVGKFDDKDANVGTERDKETEKVVTSFGKIGVKVAHAGAGLTDFGDAIDKKSN